MKKNFTEEQKREYAETFKLKNDPRITKVGKFIRKTSLDELPQLFNILKGDMTIVGPRPIVIDELEFYGECEDYYKAVKPGLTGLWQVSGRSDTTYDERVDLDMEYVTTRKRENGRPAVPCRPRQHAERTDGAGGLGSHTGREQPLAAGDHPKRRAGRIRNVPLELR